MRTRTIAVLSLLLLVACADTDEGASTPEPTAGAQGPGSPIPSTPESPAAPGSPAAPKPGEPAPPSNQPPAEETKKPAEPVVKKVLAAKWFGQETYYWCGPGSTRIALSARNATPPSQTALAKMLGTTTNGTDHIGLVANVLNQQFPGAGYKSRPMNDPPTQGQRDLLKSDLLARIGGDYPIVANVISGWRPPGYPGGTIYHYVAVIGFDQSGAKVLIADPAAQGHGGGASWNNVPQTYWISLQDLGTWIGGKGYTG